MKQSESVTLVFQFTVVAILAVVVLAFGWLTLVPGESADDALAAQLAAIEEKQQDWERQRPDSYRYMMRRRCFCGSDLTKPYRVTEESGRKTAEYIGAINSGYVTSGPAQPLWIDTLFDIASEAILNNTNVTMSFNEQYGFPDQVHVNPGCLDCDDVYTVYNFERLESAVKQE